MFEYPQGSVYDWQNCVQELTKYEYLRNSTRFQRVVKTQSGLKVIDFIRVFRYQEDLVNVGGLNDEWIWKHEYSNECYKLTSEPNGFLEFYGVIF